MVSLTDIERAADVIRNDVIRTPLVPSPTFSAMTGGTVYLKLENLQKAGSFKVRGAMNKINAVRDQIGDAGIIAASAGNHAQGVAVAAHLAGVKATIVMPEDASLTKQEATRGYGAEVILKGRTLADSIEYAKGLVKEGMVFIHPYDDPDIIAGQGTIALEIIADLPDPDLIIVPVGGGGLISGIATAARELCPHTRIIGVEAAACPSATRARESGQPVTVKPDFSIADGILVSRVGDTPFEIMERLIDEIITVNDDEISRAMLLLLERKKQLAEGAGVAGLAALLAERIKVPPGSKVVVVISGGNVDLPLLERIVRREMLCTGRIMLFSVLIADRPGSLASLLGIVAQAQGNILHIRHSRAESDLPVNTIRVELEVETRNTKHQQQIADLVQDAGYSITMK